ncbi:MAG: glycoside hydrolase family 99-like domain-containing protein, partial [Thermoguttaceae bacterium]
EVSTKKPHVPEPKPVATQILVGAQNCPLWDADQPQMWNQVLKHPERTPALGFYSQENPEVADWETKWAVEHGISFFVYCWYRNGQGGPVKMRFGSAIHDALLKSRYVSKMKFTIMWENQARGTAGVSNEADLMENLLPFWIENYFRHPSYLKIDNKPLLFIYRPEFLVQDLGGVDQVRAALDKMRVACRKAGFDGLYILGEYRGLDPNHLKLMKHLGLDYTFAYCWHVQGSPKPEQAIAAQLDYIERTRRMGILPEVVTVSQGWSGWQDEGSIWKIPPAQYKELLEKAKAIVRTFPATELGSKILLLDNWNEWSEGHYIAPHREYGFGYLDAVREVFSDAPKDHVDLLPRDVGMGPYDQAYKRQVSPRR